MQVSNLFFFVVAQVVSSCELCVRLAALQVLALPCLALLCIFCQKHGKMKPAICWLFYYPFTVMQDPRKSLQVMLVVMARWAFHASAVFPVPRADPILGCVGGSGDICFMFRSVSQYF